MKLYVVEFYIEMIEIAAESEQDAKIMASHCCNKSVKEVISVQYKGEIDKPYFKAKKIMRKGSTAADKLSKEERG